MWYIHSMDFQWESIQSFPYRRAFNVERITSSSYLVGISPWVTSSCFLRWYLPSPIYEALMVNRLYPRGTSFLQKDNEDGDILKMWCWLHMYFNILWWWALNCGQWLSWMMGLKRVIHVPWIVQIFHKVLSRGEKCLCWNLKMEKLLCWPNAQILWS